MNLTEEQIQRYSRQIVLKEVGGRGQKKLLNSKVTIIGCGGLGSPVAYYLTAAGIGNIKIVDLIPLIYQIYIGKFFILRVI